MGRTKISMRFGNGLVDKENDLVGDEQCGIDRGS